MSDGAIADPAVRNNLGGNWSNPVASAKKIIFTKLHPLEHGSTMWIITALRLMSRLTRHLFRISH